MPTVTFDPTTHTLAVVGDKWRPRDDVIDVSITKRGFVAVRVNAQMIRSIRGVGRIPVASVSAISVRGLEGNDTLSVMGQFLAAAGQIMLDGGVGNDRIVGSVLSDMLLGGDGDDTLLAGAGDDTLIGEAGNDVLDGDAGSDRVVQATDGDQTLTDTQLVGMGTDTLANIETASLSGGLGANVLDASAFTRGPVTLCGSDGDDTLRGGTDDDVLDGNAGNDRVVQMTDGDQTLTDRQLVGRGTDTLMNIEGAILTGGPSSNIFDATGFTLGSVLLDGREGEDTLRGGSGSDTLMGDAGSDSLNGGAGDDVLVGGLDNDTLEGGSGSDMLDGSEGIDQVVQGANATQVLTDSTLTGMETDLLFGIEQAALSGGTDGNLLDASAFTLGSVTLDGGAGNDTLVGGNANDDLIGGPGADRLEGRGGLDTVVQRVDSDQALTDSLLTGEGPDELVEIERASLAGGVGANTLDASNFTLGSVTLEGGDGDDTLRGGPLSDFLDGESGADSLEGGAGDDTLNGGEGDDTFAAGPGDDMLDGGPGTDLVTQSVDADQTLSDTLLTGEGTDQIREIETARLVGGPGDNVIRAVDRVGRNQFTRGSITLDGGAGNDILLSGRGSDLVLGGPGDDILTNNASGGQDTLIGAEGNDQLRSGPDPRFGGSGGANFLDAGPGDDELFAFGSNDTLLGGPGSDTFSSRCGIEFVSDMDDSDINGGCDPGLF